MIKLTLTLPRLFVECKPRFQSPHRHCNQKIKFTCLTKGKDLIGLWQNIGSLSDYNHPLGIVLAIIRQTGAGSLEPGLGLSYHLTYFGEFHMEWVWMMHDVWVELPTSWSTTIQYSTGDKPCFIMDSKEMKL